MAAIGTLSGADMMSQSCFQSIVTLHLETRGLASRLEFPLRLDLRFELHRRGTRDASVFSYPPEVHYQQNQQNRGNGDAVPDIGAQQRIRIHNRSAQQGETDVVVRSHAELRPKRTLGTQQ